jgi:hypothetical protein
MHRALLVMKTWDFCILVNQFFNVQIMDTPRMAHSNGKFVWSWSGQTFQAQNAQKTTQNQIISTSKQALHWNKVVNLPTVYLLDSLSAGYHENIGEISEWRRGVWWRLHMLQVIGYVYSSASHVTPVYLKIDPGLKQMTS